MAGFGSWTSKVDLFHPFGCKKDSKITKNGIKSLFGTLGALHTQKATQEWKLTLRWLGEAKIGPDAPHAVQLTCLGPKKNNFETARSKPHFFTRNDPTPNSFLYIKVNIYTICKTCLRQPRRITLPMRSTWHSRRCHLWTRFAQLAIVYLPMPNEDRSGQEAEILTSRHY